MSFANTSILINRQVPEFVREEYPLFITFLEAYYEFLEQKQSGELNDLTQQAKNLRYLSDVDYSIESFENQFFNTFASLIPKNIEVNKEFLIKNVLPVYLSKGSEASFKLLFRMLFNDEVSIIQPKNNVLRASDGKWTIDNTLRIETDVRSVYNGNGSNTQFILAQTSTPDDIQVYVNDILKTEGTDYFIRQETKKVVFVTAPVANSVVKIYYNNFDITLLNNRKIIGVASGASALVENATKRIITDRLNFGLPFELFIKSKTLIGNFLNGEKITSNIINSDGVKIELEADTFSILTRIDIIDGGATYNVGDPVTVVGGGAVSSATAEVESVTTGYTSRFVVNYGGAGFKNASIISSYGLPGGAVITGAVDGINTAHFTANSYTVLGVDVIEDFKNVTINALNYGFPGPYTENVTTRLVDAFTTVTVTDIGPITNAIVLFSNFSGNTTSLDSEGAQYNAGNSVFDIKDIGSIGRIDVYSGGSNYKVGDEINFGTNPYGTIGTGAAAAVRTVNPSGSILTIQVQPQRMTGTANVLNNTVQIVGTGTDFTTLSIGDRIVIKNQERFINAISSSTSANVNVAFSWTDGTTWANNYKIGSYSLGPIGGLNYTQNNFPTVNVSTASGGSGANIAITSLMGNGEQIQAIADASGGQILSIKLTSGGIGYEYIPQVDLSNYGDGSAVANAILGGVYTTLPGRWLTSDSILSNSERRLQGEDYYVDYSYVTSSLTDFKKYKNILKQLMHPAGFVNYADVNKQFDSNVTIITVETTTNTISGNVSVTGNSIFISGSGTRFNVANSRGILTLGSNVAVNGEIRTVNSIISNSNISVSSAFTYSANDQTLIILT
jgi:hypothetical protein